MKTGRIIAINPFVQIAQDAGGHAPDIALAEGDRVIVPRHALPVARMALHVGLVHQKSERHLEGVVDFGGVERERKARLDARDRRHDAIAERGHIEIEIAERLDDAAVEADLLVAPRATPLPAGCRRSCRSCRRETKSGPG